jgi:tetratricopeptide (TPR) repeat protein
MQENKIRNLVFARAFGIALCAAVLVLTGSGVVRAQTSTAPTVTETRARRATATATPAITEDEPVSTDASPAGGGQSAATTPAVTTATAVKGDNAPAADQVKPDRIAMLRAQIKSAKTEVERVRAQRTLVDYLIALDRKGEAAEELRQMLSAERLDAATFYNIGNGLARLGDDAKAIEAYRKAIEARQGNYPRALNNLGVILLKTGKMDEAYDAFVLAIKQQGFRYAEASYNLGRLYAVRDEADLAISEWTRSLTVQPDHVDSAIALARAYAVTGKADKGVEVLDATLRRVGENARLEAARDEIVAESASAK